MANIPNCIVNYVTEIEIWSYRGSGGDLFFGVFALSGQNGESLQKISTFFPSVSFLYTNLDSHTKTLVMMRNSIFDRIVD